MPGRYNSSSIEGGIFAEVEVRAPPPRASHASNSSIEGGIFGAAAPACRPTTPRSNMTASSVDGGVFGGQVWKEKENARSRGAAPIAKDHVAGVPLKRDGEAYVAPLVSARGDPNRSSIEGGIFAHGAPTPQRNVPRGNPNRSSVEGGIFG